MAFDLKRTLACVVVVPLLLTSCDKDAKSADPSASTSSPSTTPTKPPDPVPVQALEGLLLPVEEINELMGSTTMEVTSKGNGLVDKTDQYNPPDCASLDDVLQKRLYEGTGWIGSRYIGMREKKEIWDHYAGQSIVSYPSAEDAQRAFDKAADQWNQCSGSKTYSWTRPNGSKTFWILGELSNADGMLTNTRTEEGGEGWACQRAITVKNNLVIDIIACMVEPTDRAETIARAITAKVKG